MKRNRIQELLPSKVAAVLEALRPIPEPDEATWTTSRRAFLTEVHQFATEAVSPEPVLRRRTWKAFLPINLTGGSMAAIAKVLVAVVLMLGAAVGAVSATQESLPGSLLYPVKVQYEDWQLAAVQDSESKAGLSLAYAQNRIGEAERLVEQGREIPETVSVRYQRQVSFTLQTMRMLDASAQLQMRDSFSGTMQSHVRIMEHLMDRVNANPAQDHAGPTLARIQAMMQTMLQAQQELGVEPPAGPGPHPGDNSDGSGGPCIGDCDAPKGGHLDSQNTGDNGQGYHNDSYGGAGDSEGSTTGSGPNPVNTNTDAGGQCTEGCGTSTGGHDDQNTHNSQPGHANDSQYCPGDTDGGGIQNGSPDNGGGSTDGVGGHSDGNDGSHNGGSGGK